MMFDERMGSLESGAAAGAAPRLLKLASIADPRGTLLAADSGEGMPFAAARYFIVQDVPPGAVRAQHAQRRNEELIFCPAGAVSIDLRWADGRVEHRLDDPGTALHVPPWVWVECRDFTEDAVLVVLCSHPYDPEGHITDLAEFEAGPPGQP
jgi:dTDP-4-dehydrorhamnose 3,5-epimerase-like enzyme